MCTKTEIVLPNSSLTIIHEPTTGDPGRVSGGVLITEADVTPTTLTTIGILAQKETRNVHVLWRPESWHLQFSVLFVEDTSTLFVGGGTFAAIVDTKSMCIVHQHKVLLFWSFQHATNSVIQLSEDECFLFRTNGTLVGSVPVDPPYDIVKHQSAVEFISSMYGSQRIPYPESP